jgi:hypothetical protein
MKHDSINTFTNELLTIRTLAVQVITKIDDLLKDPKNFEAKSTPDQDRALPRNFVGHGFAGHMYLLGKEDENDKGGE